MGIQLTVIGLNRLGASIGLALKSKTDQILCVCNDISVGDEQKAVKMEAFDKALHNIPEAVEEADIVVITLPMDEVRKNLEIIAPVLKEGAVVLNTSPLPAAVNKWVENLFPESRYLVSFTPTINPAHIADNNETLDQASADLFQKSLVVISAPAKTHPDAIKLAGDLAGILGGKAYFCDPLEIDGLMALIDMLPKLTSAALVSAISKQPGWREGRKFAGHNFFAATEPINHFDEQKELGTTALLNHENTTRVLDYLVDELLHIKEVIQNQDSDELNKILTESVDVRQKWWRDRQQAAWELAPESPPLPSSFQMMGKLIGFNPFKTKPPAKK